MKFKKGDRVRVLSVEEIISKFPNRVKYKDGEFWYYESGSGEHHSVSLRHLDYLGKECNVRLARKFTCRIDEAMDKTLSFPNEILEFIDNIPFENEIKTIAFLSELMAKRITTSDELVSEISKTAKKIYSIYNQ